MKQIALVGVIGICIGAALGGVSGYRLGFGGGVVQGEDIGFAKAKISNCTTDCVYLTLSFRRENEGDKIGAEDLRYRLLYGAAVELHKAAHHHALSNEHRKSARKVVQGVVDYYRDHPESLSFFSRDSFLDQVARPALERMIAEYPIK